MTPSSGVVSPPQVRPRPLTLFLLPGLGVAFALALIVALTRTVPDVAERALAEPGAARPVSLRVTPGAEDVIVRQLELQTSDAFALSQADELRLVFGTYETAPRLLSGSITLAGTRCEFQASPATLSDNRLVAFRRSAPCVGLPANPPVLLSVRVQGASARDARLVVWGVERPDARDHLLSFVDADRSLALIGRSVKMLSASRVRRIHLLAFLWNTSPARLWLLLAIAAAMTLGGAATLLRPGIGWNALSVALLGAGIAMSYAVVVPPLQAPDEPDHLLSFAQLTGHQDLSAATSTWARRVHFDRIWHDPTERFTPVDRYTPYPRDWPKEDVFAEDVTRRSTTTMRLWQGMAWGVPDDPAHALLTFRVADALVFGLALAGGVALVAASGGVAFPAFCALLLLIAPTLPFFGMHMSELTFSLAAVIVLACSIVVLLGDARTEWTGVVIGLATAFLAAGPRNMWPMLGVVGALLAGRTIMGTRDAAPLRSAAVFWSGFALPIVVLFGTRSLWVPSPFYEQWHLESFDPRIRVPHLVIVAVGAGIAVLGFLAEWLGTTVRRRVSPGPFVLGVRVGVLGMAVWIAATLAWSVLHQMPMLDTVEAWQPASAGVYARAVLAPVVTWSRVSGFDLLTWSSLWGGFGWADTILPYWIIAAITLAGVAAALSQTIAAARAGDGGRRAGWIVIVTIGIVAAIAACAISAYGLHRNVHGRYLLGPYMAGVALLGSGIALPGRTPKTAGWRAAGLLTAVLAVHAYSLGFLLERYFG